MQVVTEKRTLRGSRRYFGYSDRFNCLGLGTKFAAIKLAVRAFPGGPSFQRIAAERTLHERVSWFPEDKTL
jgi:hypothetical protein